MKKIYFKLKRLIVILLWGNDIEKHKVFFSFLFSGSHLFLHVQITLISIAVDDSF